MVHADLMRSFVDTKEVSDTMTGTMQVVDAAFPHGTAGKYIELGTTSSGREVGILQLQMTFQYQGIIGFLFVGERTEGDGTGDVGSAIQILCPLSSKRRPSGFNGMSVSGVAS